MVGRYVRPAPIDHRYGVVARGSLIGYGARSCDGGIPEERGIDGSSSSASQPVSVSFCVCVCVREHGIIALRRSIIPFIPPLRMP